ncbi:hypothetical protein GCM10007984_31560 [Shewanella putrefaciens]|nr:hypothetical protein SPWS13_2430 [Shewanella putrefaciens]GGN27928.1 hypothetical protein GCM10007984_31560 [Shewanella putrefaciens]
MSKLIIFIIALVFFTSRPPTDDFDYDAFVKAYHHAQIMTQQPNATKDDLERYLSLSYR